VFRAAVAICLLASNPSKTGRELGMTRLLVAGGQQRSLRPLTAAEDWYAYQRGMILEIDTDSAEVRLGLEYVSPPEVCSDDDPAILFKSGTVERGRLYICTQTEILILRLPDLDRVGYLSLPIFNDLHHVRPSTTGTLLVADSGLDMVVEVSYEGTVLREWSTADEPLWTRFSKDVDYRKVRSTKPHRAHPNYVFMLGDEIWATRFEQRDAISLTRPRRHIDIQLERPHDGLVHEGRIFFTTVDGLVPIVDASTLRVEKVIDLNRMNDADTVSGWCRGILLDRDKLWVGYSRIRPTRFRENLGWVKRGFKRDRGTHIACYDLVEGRRISAIDLEQHGLSAVFGIFRQSARTNET
jgi:hypothetical protein